MTTPATADEILDFAIAREEEAAAFYSRLAAGAPSPDMRRTFEQFAKEERGHKARLVAVKEGQQLLGGTGQVTDLQIADYTVAQEATPDMEYPAALILAMKREKAAFRLYSKLAEQTTGELARLFGELATEEAHHKLRFEVEYDQEVLVEN